MLWFVGTGIDGYRGLSVATRCLKKMPGCLYWKVHQRSFWGRHKGIELFWSEYPASAKMVCRRRQGYHRISQDQKCSTCDIWWSSYCHDPLRTSLRSCQKLGQNGGSSFSIRHCIYNWRERLHVYKFGRMVTMMSDLHSAITVYNTVFQNLLTGNHTVILTEYSYNDESKEPFSSIRLLSLICC